jgi:hypothetical protein
MIAKIPVLIRVCALLGFGLVEPLVRLSAVPLATAQDAAISGGPSGMTIVVRLPGSESAAEPGRSATRPPEQTARGRVVDPFGSPVSGAAIDIRGITFVGGGGAFGTIDGVDQHAVTDTRGEFRLTSSKPAAAMLGTVSASAYANQSIKLALGQVQTVILTKGGTLSGRVMFNGTPMPNLLVGVSSIDRSENYVGSFKATTDGDGRFLFSNLPPNTDFYVYGRMKAVVRLGVISARRVHIRRDNEDTDLGDLEVRPGLRLTGRVVLADGEKIPENSHLALNREKVSDSLSVELGPEGKFDLQGLPSDAFSIYVRIPGYKISDKNQSYNANNDCLVGVINADIVGLELLMEKRAPMNLVFSTTLSAQPAAKTSPRNAPLRGVESRPE